MKRLARLVGILGGVGAVVWAMRDRFVSVATSREPEPPTFRVVNESTQVTSPPPESLDAEVELTTITGIGPTYATRLEAAGISSITDLAASTVREVASAAGVADSRATDWIAQATQLRT